MKLKPLSCALLALVGVAVLESHGLSSAQEEEGLQQVIHLGPRVHTRIMIWNRAGIHGQSVALWHVEHRLPSYVLTGDCSG